tara:strand:- start:4356 stop:4682 length:327 start_codon:yes stop_codon:yes gene_type:complete
MKIQQIFEEDSNSIIRRISRGRASETFTDDSMVDLASQAMKDKLRVSRRRVRQGWWRKDICSTERLKKMMANHIDKGDMVDVMNFAAMIFVREAQEAYEARAKKEANG